jgi:MFS family permease
VAKIVAGISFDKFGLRATLFMGHAIAAVSIFMLAMVTGTGYVLAGAYEILVSFALPLETIMLPLIAADMFGEKAYAKMMGLTVSINTAGYALGGPVANWFRDTVGTYKGALLGMSALMIVIIVVFQFALVRAGKDRKRIVAAAEVQA